MFGAVQEMKVWPFGVALRGEAPNHHMLRWLKTVVVSDVEKASLGVRWGSGRRVNPNRCRRVVTKEVTSKPWPWLGLRELGLAECPITGQAVSGMETA